MDKLMLNNITIRQFVSVMNSSVNVGKGYKTMVIILYVEAVSMIPNLKNLYLTFLENPPDIVTNYMIFIRLF